VKSRIFTPSSALPAWPHGFDDGPWGLGHLGHEDPFSFPTNTPPLLGGDRLKDSEFLSPDQELGWSQATGALGQVDHGNWRSSAGRESFYPGNDGELGTTRGSWQSSVGREPLYPGNDGELGTIRGNWQPSAGRESLFSGKDGGTSITGMSSRCSRCGSSYRQVPVDEWGHPTEGSSYPNAHGTAHKSRRLPRLCPTCSSLSQSGTTNFQSAGTGIGIGISSSLPPAYDLGDDDPSFPGQHSRAVGRHKGGGFNAQVNQGMALQQSSPPMDAQNLQLQRYQPPHTLGGPYDYQERRHMGGGLNAQVNQGMPLRRSSPPMDAKNLQLQRYQPPHGLGGPYDHQEKYPAADAYGHRSRGVLVSGSQHGVPGTGMKGILKRGNRTRSSSHNAPNFHTMSAMSGGSGAAVFGRHMNDTW